MANIFVRMPSDASLLQKKYLALKYFLNPNLELGISWKLFLSFFIQMAVDILCKTFYPEK